MSFTVSAFRYGTNTEVKWINPSWGEVQELIRHLDGRTHCDLFIENPEGSGQEMFISGGNQGRYVVVVQKRDQGYWYLANRGSSRKPVAVVMGGLERYEPANQVQKIRMVFRAARHFLTTATKDRRLCWVRGNRN
jgi:hypothetical protein